MTLLDADVHRSLSDATARQRIDAAGPWRLHRGRLVGLGAYRELVSDGPAYCLHGSPIPGDCADCADDILALTERSTP
jgi:hypothetical protein